MSGWRYVALAPLLVLAIGNAVVGVRNLSAKASIIRIWPLTTRNWACELDATAVVNRLGIQTFAQTDYQRLKYFSDRIQVIDATGLNDKVAAHLPAPGQVLFGKGWTSYAVARNPEAYSYGLRYPFTEQPMARFSGRELLFDSALLRTYLGTTFEAPHGQPADAQKILDRFRPASVPACGRYFNFWLRDDIAERVHEAGVVVGARDFEYPIALDYEGDSHRFEGFEPVERYGGVPRRWTRRKGVVHLRQLPNLGRRNENCSVIVLTGDGSRPFEVRANGTPLIRDADSARFVLAASTLTDHDALTLEIDTNVSRSRAEDNEDVPGVLVTGLGIECSGAH